MFRQPDKIETMRITRGTSDPIIDRISEPLRTYEMDHPDARIDLYRQNPVSVQVRIIDPGFAGENRAERSNKIWQYLDSLSDDDLSDLSSLILLTPEETEMSFANLEFEDPVPSHP